MKYPNPCEKCRRAEDCTNYRKCKPYMQRFYTIWKQFYAYPVRIYRGKKNMKSNKFAYEHPDIVRRYLEKGPCEKCRLSESCETPCLVYWEWWDARMEWIRRRFWE